ncbi:MAG: hypothetical protein M0Q44_11205 [Methylobacter sp.]|jgi:hypothetical protein|nr:hypothetical protein [Methylobacter sp.]
MTQFGIVAVLIVLLITLLIILKRRKKCSSCSPKETLIGKPKAPEQEKQQPEITLVDKPITSAVPTAVNGQITDVVSSPEPKPKNKPIGDIDPSAKPKAGAPISGLPQDSILRRHYMTHLCTMLESLVPPRPTDSVLRRHYDAMIVTQIAQCLNDKKAMEQLLHAYANKN